MVEQTETSRSGNGRPPDPGEHRRPEFGARNTHKPIKAIIGIAILLILSFVLYQFRDKARNQGPNPAPASQGTTAPKS
jgi:hypothetical protein